MLISQTIWFSDYVHFSQSETDQSTCSIGDFLQVSVVNLLKMKFCFQKNNARETHTITNTLHGDNFVAKYFLQGA